MGVNEGQTKRVAARKCCTKRREMVQARLTALKPLH